MQRTQTTSTVTLSPAEPPSTGNSPRTLSPIRVGNEGVLLELRIAPDEDTATTAPATEPQPTKKPCHVRWDEDTLDNESLGRKKSKSNNTFDYDDLYFLFVSIQSVVFITNRSRLVRVRRSHPQAVVTTLVSTHTHSQ